MKSAHSAAVNSNQRIFPIFARKLGSGDPKEFLNTAGKLTTWLGSEKAYYPAARPKIVELLEIALGAFMNTYVHHVAAPEFSGQLRKLVEVVIPFIHLFPEQELKSRLQRIVLAAEHSLSGAALPATANSTSSAPPPLPNHHPQPPLMLPTPSNPTPHVQPSIPVIAPVDIPQPSHTVETAFSQAGAPPSVTSSVTNIPHDLDEKPVLSKPHPKRARRAELSEELVARDLDWFKTHRTVSGGGDGDHDMPLVKTESSPILASDAIHIPGPSPSLKRKSTARMVPSRRLPRRITLDPTREAMSAVSVSASPPASELKTEAASFENIPVQNAPEERMEPDVQPTTIPMQDAVQNEELPPPEPRPGSNELVIKPEIPQTDDRFPSVEAPPVNGESAVPTRLSVPLPETTADGMQSMDISPPSVGSVSRPSEQPHKLEYTPMQSPEPLSLRSPILPPPVASWEPPLNLNFRMPVDRPLQPDANQGRFDDKMVVIYSTQGKPFSHTHMIDISLNESIYSKLSKWVNRKSQPSEAPHGGCISLACYRLPELFDAITSGGTHDMQARMRQSTCSWPRSNLSLHVDNGTRRIVVPLSPPFFLTPDRCVDLSSLMKLGQNALEIRQQGDLSEYLVVLHAHPPTRAQCAELDVVQTLDARWKRLLDVVSCRAVSESVLGGGGVEVGGGRGMF